MPYEVRLEERGVYSRFFGFVTGEEIIEHAKRIVGDPRAAELKYEISDFKSIEGHAIRRSDVLFAAAKDSSLASIPLAIIYSPIRPEDRELIELHFNSPLMERRMTRSFECESEARAWIATIAG